VIESPFSEGNCDEIVKENIGTDGINRKGWNYWNEFKRLILKRSGETRPKIRHL
jgi:hypothetical protein